MPTDSSNQLAISRLKRMNNGIIGLIPAMLPASHTGSTNPYSVTADWQRLRGLRPRFRGSTATASVTRSTPVHTSPVSPPQPAAVRRAPEDREMAGENLHLHRPRAAP